MKNFIKVSTGHLDTVFERMDNTIVQQLSEIEDKGAIEQVSQSSILLRYAIFSKVLRKLSGFALKITYQQYAMVRLDAAFGNYTLLLCKKILTKIMGIPCSHQIKKYINLAIK